MKARIEREKASLEASMAEQKNAFLTHKEVLHNEKLEILEQKEKVYFNILSKWVQNSSKTFFFTLLPKENLSALYFLK